MLGRFACHVTFTALVLSLAAPALAAQQGERYDLLIRGGVVHDGTGAPGRSLDVAISGGRVVALAPSLSAARAARVIDAAGRAVRPASGKVQSRYTSSPAGARKVEMLLPSWASEGGAAQLRRMVANPVVEDSILRGMVDNILTMPGVSDLSRVQFSGVSWDTRGEAKTLRQLAECRNLEPTPENGARVVLESVLSGGDSATFRVADSAERTVLRVGAYADLVVTTSPSSRAASVGSPDAEDDIDLVILAGLIVYDRRTASVPPPAAR